MDGGGWDSYYNSIRMACYTAFFGTIVVFAGAYFVEKSRGLKTGRSILHLLSMMPMAIPGLVLGLAYIFFFNHPDNPLNFYMAQWPYWLFVQLPTFIPYRI